MKVAVIGGWHLGSTIACCLADRGMKVTLWDQDPRVSQSWREGELPIFEPGLGDIVKRTWKKTLFWSDVPDTRSADWILLTYDTPVNDQDEVMLESVEKGFHAVLETGFSNEACFFVTCQVPVGTTRKFLEKARQARPSWKGHFLYQPENLRLGTAIQSFLKPDRAVLGIDPVDEPTRKDLEAKFRELIGQGELKIDRMSLESAEMVKHALNSFLGTCIVFANEISNLCETHGANAWDVFASLKQDSRVGSRAFLTPGLGFAGGTLARDLKILGKFSEEGAPSDLKSRGWGSADFFSEIYQRNERRNDWVIETLKKKCGSLSGKKIALLGVTYKPQTSTVRRSPAIQIGKLLVAQGAVCRANDPMADLSELAPSEARELPFKLIQDFQETLNQADAAVLITEWPQFREMNWRQHAREMKKALFIDTKNYLSMLDSIEGVERIVPGLPADDLSALNR